jgi:hypothetical protein
MFLICIDVRNEPVRAELSVQVPRIDIVSTKGLSRSAPDWGLFVACCTARTTSISPPFGGPEIASMLDNGAAGDSDHKAPGGHHCHGCL